MLKSQTDYLITEHPYLSGQIQAGLLLAIAGRVTPIGDPSTISGHSLSESLTRNWQVLGETYDNGKCKVYTVRDLDTTPRRWSCNCEQGQTYGPTSIFLGKSESRICKHICAVGILWLQCEYPGKPTSLWELFTRLVSEQAIYLLAGEAVELPTPHKVKLEYYDKNGQSGLVLKTGKARSEILARWLPVEGQVSGGEWRIVGEAGSRYREFVSKINGKA